MKTIEALKQNEFTVFVGWGKATQAKAREIGVSNFHRMDMDGAWKQAQFFYPNDVYVLRPDYTEPDAGVEKKTVYPDENELYFEDAGEPCKMSSAVNSKDFIGYLYEDGKISTLTRRYKHLTDGAVYDNAGLSGIDDYKVLTPTHVLFRKGL